MSRLKSYEGMKFLSCLKHIKLVSMVLVLAMILSSINVSATEQKAFADARVITVKQDGTGDFKFINDAAQAAQPGDTVLIYGGTYRETVVAPRGGSNENTRITYKAAPGQQVIIKGSDLAPSWSFDNASQTWMKTLPNSYFGSFNPFGTHWAKGNLPGSTQLRTAGSVYLNDSLLTERASLSEVQNTPHTWIAKVDSVTTTVYANFGVDPNANTVELTKRKQVFTASWNTGYITVDGLTIMHGAGTKDIDYWRPAAIPMEGALSTNGGYNWIIQNSVLKHNGGVALDFGLGSAMNEAKYGTPAKYGYHIIRNNIIKDNNTNGAFAYKGPFTEVYHNKFINNNALNTGLLSEAYLKIIDNGTGANIHDNYFYSNQSWMSYPVWLDSEVQNYKFSRNVIVTTNKDSVFFDEANYGSNVIDDNVFIGSGVSILESQGTSLVHNMFIDSNVSFNATHFPGFPGLQVQGADIDGYRHMMLYRPGTLDPLGTVATRTKYNKVFNNIFYNKGMSTSPSFIDGRPFLEPVTLDEATTNLWGNEVDYNVNYNGAVKIADYTLHSYTPDTHSAEISGNPASASCDENKCTISFSVDAGNTPTNLGAQKITGAYLGKNHVLATMPDSIFKLPDGNKPDGVTHNGPSPIDNYIEDVTTDFYGNVRTGNTVAVGPFQNILPGSNTLVVWSGDAALKGLTLSGISLNQTISGDVYSYHASVPQYASSTVISATYGDGGAVATMTFNGTPIINNSQVVLNIGTNTLQIQIEARDGTKSEYNVTIQRASSSSSGSSRSPSSSGGTTGPEPSTTTSTDPGIVFSIDGKQQESLGTAINSMDNGRASVKVKMNDAQIDSFIKNAGEKPSLNVAAQSADQVTVEMNASSWKSLQNKQAVFIVSTKDANYTLTAAQINLERLSHQFNSAATLTNISLHITVAKSPGETAKVLDGISAKEKFRLLTTPVDFNIAATYNGKTVLVDTFNSYVLREIVLPEGIDPAQISTGVAVDADQAVRQVPTNIIRRDGKLYARLYSLTNSTYVIVSHPVQFADMESHWAKNEVNDLASRLIVNGIDKAEFKPDRPIARSEFAAIIVRALGLNGSLSVSTFSDVSSSDWFKDSVNQAYQYGIVSGYPDGSFGPTASVTREEAMSMIARGMKVINPAASMDGSEQDVLLSSFADKALVSEWAKKNVALLVKSGLIQGEADTLQPGRSMTRAETAVIVKRMLIQAGFVGTTLNN
ncbi:hypothetical protein GC093_11050 [Paenibacillus sp. LMG 31456]|uniref:SLH domain-containing protein n=1 Tax=Paenibacillus foliorum TaxID=2654974 RepID=A0A972GPH2_9BACL|nr:S-layer homology domain-containing protein [Paenibacillus foliorum]NOU93755.1 hypothetical protein [Paenibacillus foliorum]